MVFSWFQVVLPYFMDGVLGIIFFKKGRNRGDIVPGKTVWLYWKERNALRKKEESSIAEKRISVLSLSKPVLAIVAEAGLDQ